MAAPGGLPSLTPTLADAAGRGAGERAAAAGGGGAGQHCRRACRLAGWAGVPVPARHADAPPHGDADGLRFRDHGVLCAGPGRAGAGRDRPARAPDRAAGAGGAVWGALLPVAATLTGVLRDGRRTRAVYAGALRTADAARPAACT